jgi:hypothetical protein
VSIRVPPRDGGINALSEGEPFADVEPPPGVSPVPGVTLRDINALPDVRDGLTREERTVLWVLHEAQKERGGRSVPTTMLWGRVCEHFYISPENLSEMLARLGARKRR